jgi:rhamnosyltransferase
MHYQVQVLVPTRNPGALWNAWLSALASQQPPVVGFIIDSSSNDGTNFSSLPDGLHLFSISASEFNHGATRNLGLSQISSGTDIVVLMTQDALLTNDNSISQLVNAFDNPDVACAFGRQLPHIHATPIAAHARLFNYTDTSRLVTVQDKSKLGIKTCFLSNSFAAYRVSALQELGGFPSDVILGEDTTVAARMLMAGKSVAYVADACVYHSHNYSMAEEFKRYFDTGVFHARSPWLLQAFGDASGEGLRFIRSEITYLWISAPHLIPSAILRTLAKWLGYKLGRLEAFMPLKIKLMCSMHKGYWRKQADKEQAVV